MKYDNKISFITVPASCRFCPDQTPVRTISNAADGGVCYEVEADTLFITGPLVCHEQIPDEQNPMAEYCFNICKPKPLRQLF